MMSRKSNKDRGAPFYALSGRRKSSAEIIKEAKDEIRTMASRRPSTPFSKPVPDPRNNSRASSSASQVSFSPEPPCSRPLSGIRLKPLRPESSSSKELVPSLHLEPTVIKTTLNERKSRYRFTLSSESSIPASPDIFSDHGDVENGIPDGGKNKINSDVGEKSRSHREMKSIVKNKKNLLTENGSVVNIEFEDANSSEVDEEEKKLSKFQDEVSAFFPVLERLYRAGKGRSESQGIEVISKLYRVFSDSAMFHSTFESRNNLLKLLFKLLDYKHPVLSLHVTKFLLEMKVTGNNLARVCKLLYKLCQEERNIIEFLSCGILGPFFDCLQATCPTDNIDALKYSASLICILAANDLLLEVLGIFKSHEILLYYLGDICNLNDLEKNTEFSNIIIKIITALRYLIEDDKACEYSSVVTISTIQNLMKVLKVYEGDVETIITVIRLLSKIAESEDGCDTLASCASSFSVLTDLLKCYKTHLFITTQAAFIIGNLILSNENVAAKFVSSRDFMDVMIGHLDYFAKYQIEKSKKEPVLSQFDLYNIGDGKSDISGLMLKIVSIFGNMCVNSDMGCKLAKDGKFIISVIKLIESYKTCEPDSEDIHEPLTFILVTMNNITFFIQEDFEVSFLCVKIAEVVVPFLSSAYVIDVRTEACSIIRNITRIPEIRTFILEMKLMPAFVCLLDEYSNDMAVGGYAVIMNLLLDKQAKEPFYKEQGVNKLLHKLHLCMSRDWGTAALLCQILWNYCMPKEMSKKPLTHLEIQHLIKVLQYATGPTILLETDDANDKIIWETEFCDVGKKLLKLLQTY